MFSHMMLGTNNLPESIAFYDQIMPLLGCSREFTGETYAGYGNKDSDVATGINCLWIAPPFNGEPASPGNGVNVALHAVTRHQVSRCHEKALQCGGADEGAPGIREEAHPNFYAAYFRDPTGNKLAVVCHSEEINEDRINNQALEFDMTDTIELMLDLMDKTFQDFEHGMPSKPELIQLSFGSAYRFKEMDIYQALIQKLARVQSSVRAAQLLLRNGFVQEQAMLKRTIDETNEDIKFLVYAVTNDSITDLHKRFLEAFWEEEIDQSGIIITSEQKRPMIPRKKIHAYLSKVKGIDLDQSSHQELRRTISKAYSGFIHGASPHIMEMYGGNPPHFHTKGMLGTPRIDEHTDDLFNYVYRSFLSHIAVGKAIGAAAHVARLTKYLEKIESSMGMRE